MTLKISNSQVPLRGQAVNDDLQTELSGSGKTAQPPVTRSHQHNTKGHSTAPLHSSQSCQHKCSDRAISQRCWIAGKQTQSASTYKVGFCIPMKIILKATIKALTTPVFLPNISVTIADRRSVYKGSFSFSSRTNSSKQHFSSFLKHDLFSKH